MALLVSADQDAKADTGLAVAFLAKLMITDHFGFRSVLGVSWRCDHRCRSGHSSRDHRSRHQWPSDHFVSCSIAAPQQG